MKKSDLISGVHSVVFRNGKSAFYDVGVFKLDESENNDYISLKKYNEDLTSKVTKDHDVINIFETKPIWQREEKEMIEKPKKADYDFNDQFELLKYVKDLNKYTDYIEEKIKDEDDRLDINKDNKPSFNEPEKYVIKYDYYKTFALNKGFINENTSGRAVDYIEHGLYRKTKENAEYSKKRNQRSNRLEALVENLQGELDAGGIYIYKINSEYKHFTPYNNNQTFFPIMDSEIVMRGAVRTDKYSTVELYEIEMKEETAVRICEMLNNGEYSLDGE